MNQARYATRETVVEQELGAEAVLLDLEVGTYYSLNAVASLIWRDLRAGQSVSTIVDTIVESRDVTREQASMDVERLLDEALDLGLLTKA